MNPPDRTRAALEAFFRTTRFPVPRDDASGSADAAALAVFREAAATVPAYQEYLRARGVDPDGVRTAAEFRALPLVTKDEYVRVHPLAARCKGGTLDGCEALALSSGSTGEPTVWPRGVAEELAVTARFEQVFRAFGADLRRTLAVVAFPLGTWVGGLYTTACCRWLAAKGYPITVISPGNVPAEVLRSVRTLAPDFEQLILLGYPPFVKGLIDLGQTQGIRWEQYRPKLVLAGEVFTEEWRTLVAARAGIEQPARHIASLYGTADAGVLGNETPLSVAIRRLAAKRPEWARDLFGEARLPTLVQYDPYQRFLETTSERTLLFTCDGPAPLVRYHIADTGGVIPYELMMKSLERLGMDPFEEIDRDDPALTDLPFAYVFGRSHNAVSFFGANVFPEMISVGLEQPGVAEHVTGKFVMSVHEDVDRDTHLAVVVELAAGATGSAALEARVAESIGSHLARLNSEYGAYVPPERRTPRVELRQQGDAEYFPAGVKHRWTRR